MQGDGVGAPTRPRAFGPAHAGRVAGYALSIIAVALLAGCGGGGHPASTTAPAAAAPPAPKRVLDKTTYDRTMRTLGHTLATSVEGMFPLSEGGVGSPATLQALSKVKQTRSVVDRVRSTLAGILPPAPIRADHAKLISDLDTLQRELDTLIGVLQHGSNQPIGAYTNLSALNGIAVVTSDMQKKGFQVG